MFAISSAFVLIIVCFCHGTTGRSCPQDTTDFATKVEKSSVVVYGKTMAKIMNEGSDSVFHVFFQVDCILKGAATSRQINITNAGRVEGKQYCQEFPVGRGYSIAFLEPISANKTSHKTFTPVDFAEILDEGNSTSQLLARQCDLHRLVPRQSSASVTDVCPSVGTDPICQQIVNSTGLIITNLLLNITTNITLSDVTTSVINLSELTATNTSNHTVLIVGDNGHLAHPIHTPQQEIDAIRSKSGVTQVDVDTKNSGKSMTFSILLIIMAIFFCSN